MLDELERVSVVDGHGVLTGVGHPYGAALVIDGHPVDGVAGPLERLALTVDGGGVDLRDRVVLVGQCVGRRA